MFENEIVNYLGEHNHGEDVVVYWLDTSSWDGMLECAGWFVWHHGKMVHEKMNLQQLRVTFDGSIPVVREFVRTMTEVTLFKVDLLAAARAG